MAVMSLRLCRYSTIRLLCAGSTRAKQRAVVQACRCRCGGSSSNSRPVRQMTAPSCSSSCSVMMPTLRQMDRAVPLLSPGKNKQTNDYGTFNSPWSKTLALPRRGLTCDHDDSYASLTTHSDGAEDFFSRGVQHAHTAHKGQIGLGKQRRWTSRGQGHCAAGTVYTLQSAIFLFYFYSYSIFHLLFFFDSCFYSYSVSLWCLFLMRDAAKTL